MAGPGLAMPYRGAEPAACSYAARVAEPLSETVSWRTRVRAIVLHPRLVKALVLCGPDGLALPEFDLPGRLWSGDPTEAVRAIRDLLSLEVAMLRSTEERADSAGLVLGMTLVFVVRDEGMPIPENARWLGAEETGGPVDVAAVLDEVAGDGRPVGRVPWRDRAWLPTAETWMVTSLAALGRPVSAPIEQVRIGELSCVLRGHTEGGDVYFKATRRSPLFVNEGPVMATLSKLFPACVPAPLALDTPRRWMLLPDFGPAIGKDAPIDVREEVLRVFAGLQVRSVDAVDRLLATGCFERGLAWLAEQATRWLTTIDLSRWMPSDEGAKLRAVAPDLVRICAKLSELPVPRALGHGDLHLGNVARSAHGYVFFDWSDACITHPFVDMTAIFTTADPATRERLRDTYLAEWTSFAPAEILMRGWRLAEPLACLNQAITYASLASHLEPCADRDSVDDSIRHWLRRLLDWCS
jgi:hypothetical protein